MSDGVGSLTKQMFTLRFIEIQHICIKQAVRNVTILATLVIVWDKIAARVLRAVNKKKYYVYHIFI